jgi:hypothetical protein
MTDQNPSVAAEVARIESAAGGGWGAWKSDTGWWWATRNRALTPGELSAGCVQHVHASSPDELLELIQAQNALAQGITEPRPTELGIADPK